jgi:hexosaminidase
MSHPVIPAPLRFEAAGEREFAFRPGTTVTYADYGLAPMAERFCAQVTRRTGVRLVPRAGRPVPDEPSVRDRARGRGRHPGAPRAGRSLTGRRRPGRRTARAGDRRRSVLVRAVEPAGVARGLTTLIQLLAAAPPAGGGEIRVPGARILDAPRYAWRGLSLDVARTFFTVGEIRRVIDLLALYKLNVLHLHLTDDQGWRISAGRPAGRPEPGAAFYRDEDLRALAGYAAERFVTIVPEVDRPGHAAALMRRPELSTGRNEAERELLPGYGHHTVWLDPELPATFELIEQVLASMAEIFPGRYLHIGGDEPRGMPDDLYVSYIERLRHLVRSLGRRPLGWQETARAGLGPDDVIQYWLTGIGLPASVPPRVRAQMDADLAMSRRDVEAAAAASVPVIVSPLARCYLDVPYAEPPADAAQADRQGRLGLRLYAPQTVAGSFDWEPGETLGPGRDAQVAGVEAAIWAETISGFDDLSFLLLPRLAGVAHKAWSAPHLAGWAGHRDRLARHGRLWSHDDLTYFRASTVDWR